MKRVGSKESLVYHESRENMSDSDSGDDNLSFATGATSNHNYGSSMVENGILKISTYTNNSQRPALVHSGRYVSSPSVNYRDMGPQNRRSLRNLVKKERHESNATNLIGESPKSSTLNVLFEMIFGSKINVLLFAMPFAVASHKLGWSSMSIFTLNFIAMVPLASLLGAFTEEVAAHTNETIGGLINATFGNAVEVVVAIQALLADEVRVVQASMIGSIFSNLLLVLGCCFFFGGLIHKEQQFQSMTATANMSLLALSSIALVLPTPFAAYYDVDNEEVLTISRIVAVFLIIMYLQLLVFQLKTHADMFEEEEEETELPFLVAIGGLVVVTGIITIFRCVYLYSYQIQLPECQPNPNHKLLANHSSDYLVESIDGFCTESGISRTFVGLIILPIVGNAVEHATAVSVAMKDKVRSFAISEAYSSIYLKLILTSIFNNSNRVSRWISLWVSQLEAVRKYLYS